MPFTVEQFFEVFAHYNRTVWPMQVLLNLLAIIAIAVLFFRNHWKSRLLSAILCLFWLWMAIAYHFAFFTAINPAAWLFGTLFLIGAVSFAWTGVWNESLKFRRGKSTRHWSGALLIGYALIVYPVLGYMLGHRYPAVPTFGLPCPTAIFTIGILLFAVPPIPKAALVVPLCWSAIGSVAAFQLGVLQDLGLLAAGIIGLVAILSSRVHQPA